MKIPRQTWEALSEPRGKELIDKSKKNLTDLEGMKQRLNLGIIEISEERNRTNRIKCKDRKYVEGIYMNLKKHLNLKIEMACYVPGNTHTHTRSYPGH